MHCLCSPDIPTQDFLEYDDETTERTDSSPATSLVTALDGVDVSAAIRGSLPSPRDSVLSELYEPGERVHPGMWAVGYRKGRFKLVEGVFEDLSHCHESRENALNCSSTGSSWADMVHSIGQSLFQWAEYFYGDAAFDSVKGAVLLAHIHRITLQMQGGGLTYLFDLEQDPEERVNLAEVLPEVVQELREEVEAYRKRRPPQGKYWMVLPLSEQKARVVVGNCSMNPFIQPEECFFKHPFMRGPEDEEHFVHAIPEFTRHIALSFLYAGTRKLLRVMMVLAVVYVLTRLLLRPRCQVVSKRKVV